jgi:hypothetical protein
VVDKKTEKIICTEFFNGKTIFKTTLALLGRILVLADSGYQGVQKVHSNTQFPLRHKEDFGLMTHRERYRNRRKRFGLRYNLICGIVNYENRELKGFSQQV